MAAAELKLQVGLDLAFFRQQLALLGTTATGYSLPINIDRLGIQQEITKLGKNISNRSYTLKVKTTAAIAEAEVNKLKTALDNLQGKEVGIKITGTLGKIAPKDATKIRNDLAEAVAGGAGKKILVDVSVRENAIGEELRAVRKALNEKITPKNGKILVATSIRSGITNEEAKEFRESVKRKIGDIIVNVTGSADRLKSKEAKSIRTSLYQSIISNGGKIKIPATLTIADSEVAAFQKAVNSKFAGITVKIKAEVEGASSFAQSPTGAAGLEKHLQTQGLSGGNYADVGRRVRLREQLKTQSKAQLLELAKQEGLARYSKLNKDPLIERLVQEITSETAERILGNVQNMLRNAGGGGSSSAIGKMLDTLARGVFHMLGMDPAAMMAAQKQKLLPPAINWQSSVATQPQYQSKPGTMLTGAPSPTLIGGAPGPFGLLPRATRAGAMGDMRRMLSQGAGEEQPGKLALSPEAAKARVDAIIGQYLRVVEVQIKEAFSAPAELKKQLNVFSYLAQSLRDAEQRAKQSKIDSAVDGLINALESLIRNAQLRLGMRGVSIADLGANRPLLAGTSYPALPSAGETGKNRVRISTGNPFQSLPMLPAAGETGKDRVRIRTGQNLNIPFVAPQIPSAQVNRGVSSAGPTGRVEGRGASPYAFEKGFGSPEALAIENAAKQTLRLGLATDVAQRSLGKMNASQIPFIGGLRGVAGELGQATKQVLLYGAAYRALAAITSIPGQILDATKSQQQYTNGLKVATQETGTFAKELLFVDNVQRAFGLNLETTRTGFTRLYASMAPTGFDSGSIEKLFTGISAATAALQLTPDKAERVIYAFGQMASKGQIMSEELKGQLGDVLPGALAIFAKSAGMSVKEFSKAMEDGVFTGNKFREIFAKVSDELMNRFGTGAQAAGKSLQGLLSTVGGDFQRTLESFAPLANSVAQAILVPLGGALRQLSTSAQIAMGEMDRVKGQYKAARIDLGDLRAGGASAGQIRAAEQNVAALEARYKSLNKALEDPAIAKQVKDIQLFTQELAKAGTFVMNVAKTIGGILSPAINFLGTNLTATIATITSFYIGFQTARLAAMTLMGVLLLYRGISTMLGLSTAAQQATALSGAFNVLGVSASRANVSLIGTRVALTALVAATVVGAVVAGIVAIASAFATMGDKARDAAQASKDAGKAAMDAASTGNVVGAEMGVQAVLAESRKNTAARKALEAIQRRSTADQQKGALSTKITSEESVALQGSALTAGMVKAGVSSKGERYIQALSKELAQTTLKQFGSLAGQVAIDLKEAKAAVDQARKVSAKTGLNKPTPDPATKVDDDAKKANLESYYSLLDDLAKATTQAEVDRAEAAFNHKRDLINAEYDYREARANSFQKETIRFQRELFNIEMERQKAVLDANSAVAKAQGAVAGGTGGVTGLLQGSTGISSGAHFDVRRQDGGYISPQQARALFEASVAKQLQLTSTYGPRKAPVAGASTFHRGVDLAGPANTPLNLAQGYSMVGAGMKGGLGYTASVRGPQGEMYDVGHLQQPRAGVPSGKPTGRQKRVALAEQQTQNALQDTKVKTTLAEAEALKKAEIAMVNYISSIAPVAEQDLQNQLLGKRIELMKSGTPEVFAETQMKIFEAQEKVRMAGEELDLTNQKQVEAYEKLKQSLPGYIALLEDAAVKQQQLGFTKTMKDLGDRVAMAKALTPEAEMRTRLQQQGYAGAQLETLFETEKTTVKAEELKAKMQGVASTIGDAFSTAFQGIINGSMSAQEALGNMFKSIGESFVKMAMDMIAKQLVMITLGFIMKALGLASSAAGGGLSNLNAPQSINNPLGNPGTFFELPKVANGASFSNGIAKFATGGIVNGPTLFPFADGGAMQMGLMGEAGPEAIMPLQRGPDGALGVRAAMGGNGMGGSSSPILNMSFETSTINGVEYVSREQLELAMAQTRRQASRDGANKGMAMTLDKIQQSPQTRRRIGM